MQTLKEIRQILDSAGLRPKKRFGQNFLIDKNLMLKLLELSELSPDITVLEVGPGTGSLTEELIERAAKVVAVEIDSALAGQLTRRLGECDNLTVLNCDVLAAKHAINPDVLAELGPNASLVANLPYNIATPMIAQCLIDSWRVTARRQSDLCRFDRVTFTVQDEVALRLGASVGSAAYGQVSVVISLLGKLQLGPEIPGSAFWPRPKVTSRMVRIDFDASLAAAIDDIDTLTGLLSLAFGQRRKQIGSIVRRKGSPFTGEALDDALSAAGVDRTDRPEQIAPDCWAAMARTLCQHKTG